MTNLRALVGAGFLLGVMGFVVSVPLGWTIVIGRGEVYPEKISKGQSSERNEELVQKKMRPRTTYDQSRHKIEAK